MTKGSVRLDVGDTFVAAFVSKQTMDANLGAKAAAHNAATKESGSIPPSSGPATTFDVPDTRPDWQILGPAAKMLLTADGRIAVADDAPEFQQPLRGMTVDEFRQALLAAQSQN